jgi:3-hydroxyisobutyrate dehydrogenase/glyoxylate/succinic semialdehyde reductase
VTGSAPVAEDANLVFWVGADGADLETIRPLLLCMGSRIIHAGGHGMGTSMKMVINLLLGTAMAAFAEAMALGEGLGLSSKMLFDSLLGTPAVSAYEAGVAMPLTNVTKEIYRLAMRGGHDIEDFSAIYEFTMGNNGKERELNSIGDRR